MKCIRYLLLLCLFYTTPFYPLYALKEPDTNAQQTKGSWTTVHIQNFLDNTEYFNKIVEGQTIFGFHCFPSYLFWVCPNIYLNVGLIWIHHVGQKKPWHTISPLLSINYTDQNNTCLIGMCRLQQQDLPLIEPLLDPHILLKKPYIEGFFFRTKTYRYHLSICLDWLTQLNKPKNQPESFKVYLTSSYNLYALQAQNKGSLSMQLAIYHLGGQGITVQDFSLFCGTIGLNFSFKPKNPFFKAIHVAHYLLINKYIKIQRPQNIGWGHLPTIEFSLPSVNLALSYWYGNNFSSENMGTPLYQSIHLNDHKVTYHEPIRQLLFLSIHKTYTPYKIIQIKIGCKPYYDFKNQLLEYGFFIHLDCLCIMDKKTSS